MDAHRRGRPRAKARVRRERSADLPRPAALARVVPFLAPRPRAHEPREGGCLKCGSTFVAREPAFVHCRHCGSLTRIPGSSLLEQELFEIRSGLRLAS
jgi:hypothetical protein